MRTYDPMKSKKRSMNEPSSMSSDNDVGNIPNKIKDNKKALDEALTMSRPKKESFNPHGISWG